MKHITLLLGCLVASCSAAFALPKIAVPGGLQVHACGKGKLALYWDTVPGAKGYWIYRSSRSKRQDMARPLAKLRFVADSFPCSPMKLWVDKGLQEQREYFYVIRAADSAGRLSAASEEDSEYVDSGATPWDTRNPRRIVDSVVVEAQRSDPEHQSISSRGEFVVIGPDGMTYHRFKGKYYAEKPQPRDFAMPNG